MIRISLVLALSFFVISSDTGINNVLADTGISHGLFPRSLILLTSKRGSKVKLPPNDEFTNSNKNSFIDNEDIEAQSENTTEDEGITDSYGGDEDAVNDEADAGEADKNANEEIVSSDATNAHDADSGENESSSTTENRIINDDQVEENSRSDEDRSDSIDQDSESEIDESDGDKEDRSEDTGDGAGNVSESDKSANHRSSNDNGGLSLGFDGNGSLLLIVLVIAFAIILALFASAVYCCCGFSLYNACCYSTHSNAVLPLTAVPIKVKGKEQEAPQTAEAVVLVDNVVLCDAAGSPDHGDWHTTANLVY